MIIPKFSNIVELGGTLAIAHFGSQGELIEDRFYSNLVVTVGKQWIAARMKDTGIPTQMTHMAVGGNATVGSNPTKTTPVVGDTQLSTGGSPALSELARVSLTTAGGTVSGAVVTYATTFAAGTGTGSLVEAGIFNSGTSASGTMLCKTSFDVVNKAATDSIAITWTVTIQ
jgi:hypothetical protein